MATDPAAKPEVTPPRLLDLDAVQAEATGEPLQVTLRGREFTLPPSLPVGLPLFINRALTGSDGEGRLGDTEKAVRTLFGDRTDEAMQLGLTLDHLLRIADSYGLAVDLPESSASAPSSTTGSRPSKRTSKRTTASTSAAASSAPTLAASGSDASSRS